MADSPKQLVESWCALTRPNVFLYCIKLFSCEDIASQKLPLEIPAVGIFKDSFIKGTLRLAGPSPPNSPPIGLWRKTAKLFRIVSVSNLEPFKGFFRLENLILIPLGNYVDNLSDAYGVFRLLKNI